MKTPKLSIVVVAFDMKRELPRTVLSLSAPYQQDVDPDDIEIIIADNGSHEPVERHWFEQDLNLRIMRVEDGGASPCRAINLAVQQARAEKIAIVIDGARLVTPGMIFGALAASKLAENVVVSTLHFHLGPKVQQISVTEGYTRAVEDDLLASIDWSNQGYRLFEICALGESARGGVGVTPFEANFIVMEKSRFHEIGGFDERFQSIGGGLANWDFFLRAINDPLAFPVMLVGEGNFHQLHYGATTQEGGVRRRNLESEQTVWDDFIQEYRRLIGCDYERSTKPMYLFGKLTHPDATAHFFPVGD